MQTRFILNTLVRYNCKMNSAEATLVTLSLVLLLRKQPKRKQRKRPQYWMNPFNNARLLCGHHVTTLKILKTYELKFRSCYLLLLSPFSHRCRPTRSRVCIDTVAMQQRVGIATCSALQMRLTRVRSNAVAFANARQHRY
jgi:hypothetical protein